jgi:branched-chain amino acid transport system ATP-binding protein
MNDADPILKAFELTKYFGKVSAAHRLNVEIKRGEFIGIVGSNGSGKTTFINLITGYLKPDRGNVTFMGKATTGLPPRTIIKMGLARSFQLPQLYIKMEVLESLLLSLAAQSGNGGSFWHSLFRESRVTEGLKMLDRFGLKRYAYRPVSELPEGGRKLLDITMSFALRPRLLFMDEPTSGVSIEDKFEVMDTLVKVLQESDITTIFIEHDMEVVQRYAKRVLVFDQGRVIADGEPESVLADPEVRRVVLGKV